jgi:hypothetical protein
MRRQRAGGEAVAAHGCNTHTQRAEVQAAIFPATRQVVTGRTEGLRRAA